MDSFDGYKFKSMGRSVNPPTYTVIRDGDELQPSGTNALRTFTSA
jgi:hypothetical protein